VEESLPLWMKAAIGDGPFERLKGLAAHERGRIAREFWLDFVKRSGFDLPLDPDTGLPQDYAAAYKLAFDLHRGAVADPATARRLQRDLMRLDEPRLNAAHFLLASLLGVQPRKGHASTTFKAKAAFCRLILTTNFDPYLQIALQSVNRLYFMSDTPELGVSDEILDDETDAVHLVYMHGSIHRRSQFADMGAIEELKKRNARTLEPVLKRRGVIVLGYSGWDDAIVEALAACKQFDHRLYWCGRESDPLTNGAFRPRVAEILRNRTASYVQIEGAGRFLARLSDELVDGFPRLLGNPIGQIREMLETIDLTELDSVACRESTGSVEPRILEGRPRVDALVERQRPGVNRAELREERRRIGPGRAARAALGQRVNDRLERG